MTKQDSNKQMLMTLPTKSVLQATQDATLPDGELMCATGDVTCEARFWSTGSSSANDMTYSCFACDKSATTCANTVVTDSGTNDKQCSKYVSTVTGTFKQNTAADTTAATLKIT